MPVIMGNELGEPSGIRYQCVLSNNAEADGQRTGSTRATAGGLEPPGLVCRTIICTESDLVLF